MWPEQDDDPDAVPRTLGELVVSVSDEAARWARRPHERRRLAAQLLAAALLSSGHGALLRRLAAEP